MLDFRTSGAVRGFPVNAIANHAAAAILAAAFAVDAEGDAKLVLVEAHHQGVLSERHRQFGAGGGAGAERHHRQEA